MNKKLRFGLPKGSLQDATIEKMAKAGFNISVSSRSYVPYVDDDELEIRLILQQAGQSGVAGAGDAHCQQSGGVADFVMVPAPVG